MPVDLGGYEAFTHHTLGKNYNVDGSINIKSGIINCYCNRCVYHRIFLSIYHVRAFTIIIYPGIIRVAMVYLLYTSTVF